MKRAAGVGGGQILCSKCSRISGWMEVGVGVGESEEGEILRGSCPGVESATSMVPSFPRGQTRQLQVQGGCKD